MKITVEKNILLDDCFSYVLKNIEGSNNVFLDMISKGFYVIATKEDDKVVTHSILDDCELGIFLVHSIMVDNGDYDYEDEWIPNFQEEDHYHQILFCPYTGEKIEFNIIDGYDYRTEQKTLMEEMDAIVKCRSKKKREEYKGLYKRLADLTQNKFYL